MEADPATAPAPPPVPTRAADATPDARLAPALLARRTSTTWTFAENVKRVVWMFTQATLFRYSFHSAYRFRRALLRCFGAKVGRGVLVRPTVRVEIPWNLEIGDDSALGDFAIVYSLGRVTIGRLTIVSQYAHLCAGTHDHTRRTFPLIRAPITLGDDVWVAADAFVGPGVTVGDRSIVAARATVVKDVPPDQVVGGNPARFIKRRELRDG